MLSWLQAKSVLSTNLATSSGVNPHRSSLNFQQESDVVDNPSEARSPFWLLPNRGSEVLEFLSLNIRTDVKRVLN